MDPERMAAPTRISCPTIAETPRDRACFFGFHDVTPWAPGNDRLAVLRVDPALRRLPNGSDVAEVCLWHPDTGRLDPVGETRAWNFQMGARAQWLPDGRLVWNTLDGTRCGAEILDPESGECTRLDFAVSAISPDGREALAPHFGRLARAWPAYGIAGADAPGLGETAPATDGLWRIDLMSNRAELLLPFPEIAGIGGRIAEESVQFVTHPSYNRSGSRFVFLHRFFTGDGALFSRLVAANRDGSGLRLLAEEKVSHFDWLDDDTLVVWARFLGGTLAAARRSGLLANPALRPLVRIARKLRAHTGHSLANECYFRIDVASGGKAAVGAGLLTRDGHPMFGHGGRWMLTDTYPDGARQQALILFDMTTNERIDIGSFHADPSVGDGDIKCDLHPRWDCSGRLICVDTTDSGTRQCRIVDAGPALDTRGGDGA
jgi:hypothetical protein